MSDLETYQARAAQARTDAEEALLPNIKDRCLRAEAAWTAMAARVERSQRLREAADAEKAANALSQLAS
jgi:hypothetical protein